MSLILKPKSYQSFGMRCIEWDVYAAIFIWADDTRTVLKLKMSYSLRHFFIMTRAQECYKSARPESCNRTCKNSWNPLPFVSLSPCLITITVSLCPWKCVGCSWYGSTWLWKHWLSFWELQRHSELTWGDELCCQHSQVWVISLLVQKPWIQEPFS